jgi:hypothetical protein
VMCIGACEELEQLMVDWHQGIVGLDGDVHMRLTCLRRAIEAFRPGPAPVSSSSPLGQSAFRCCRSKTRLAEEVSSDSGIPERLLPENDAIVRQTHRRASVIVVDVPEDRPARAAARARGDSSRVRRNLSTRC